MDGYGGLRNDIAFRTAIHIGVYLICWYIRGNPKRSGIFTPELVAGLIQIGRDLILKGWERDREWFKESAFACLFTIKSSEKVLKVLD